MVSARKGLPWALCAVDLRVLPETPRLRVSEEGGEAMSMYGDGNAKQELYDAIEFAKRDYECEMDFLADLASILSDYLEWAGYGQEGQWYHRDRKAER